MFGHLTLTLAQEDAPPSSPSMPIEQAPAGGAQPIGPGPGTAPPRGGIDPIFMIVLGAIVVMIIFSTTGQRKEKKKREALLAAVKKGDKVQTVGGILGNVLEVKDSHVVVKIDENTNTRVKFARSAIQTILKDDSSE